MKPFKSVVAVSLMVTGALAWSAIEGISPVPAQTSQPTILIASNPTTYMTVIDDDHIVVQITEGEFRFHGWLERQANNQFIGEDSQVRVMYDRDTSQLVVINKLTGDEFYNYTFSIADEGAL